MATPQQVERLKNLAAGIDKVDLEKLARRNLGEESLSAALEPRLQKINRLKTLATQYAEGAHGSAVDSIANIFQALEQSMTQQASRANPEFISQRQPFLSNIDTHLENAKQWEPYFIAAAVETRGFLEDEGIRQEYKRTVEELKNEAKKTVEEVKTEATRAIEEAKRLAAEIEERARRTAAKVSVEEAQRQFKEAQPGFDQSVKLWSWLSTLAIFAFFAVAVGLAYLPLPSSEGTSWQGLYHTALRIAILSGMGAVTGFCLKVLRAYMNMRERNLHRQRVANSIEAFVVSAQTPEVRDVILAQLTDSVVTFGVSGLLTRDTDSLATQRISADAVSRLLGIMTGKKE